MLKKVIIVALCLIFALSCVVFAACGKTPQTEQPQIAETSDLPQDSSEASAVTKTLTVFGTDWEVEICATQTGAAIWVSEPISLEAGREFRIRFNDEKALGSSNVCVAEESGSYCIKAVLDKSADGSTVFGEIKLIAVNGNSNPNDDIVSNSPPHSNGCNAEHTDANDDGICDVCGKVLDVDNGIEFGSNGVSNGCAVEHEDINDDGLCDACGKVLDVDNGIEFNGNGCGAEHQHCHHDDHEGCGK